MSAVFSTSGSSNTCNNVPITARSFHATSAVAAEAAVPASTGLDIALAKDALAHADCVCFDVDSTVICDEGIDVLAAHLGKGAEVSAWTSKAMDGNVKFEDALAARLDIIKPSRKNFDECHEIHPPRLSPGVKELIDALHAAGKDVYLVSGGFRLMIEPVAALVNVPIERIIANTVMFDSEGLYSTFDATELTSADGGKPKAIAMLKEKYGYGKMVMVGDGATDAQAKPPATAFIGYGGVTARAAVLAKADWFVYDFQEMIAVVEGGN
jgi:phosphoserine phosphatase